jgi:hypothetical protein
LAVTRADDARQKHSDSLNQEEHKEHEESKSITWLFFVFFVVQSLAQIRPIDRSASERGL